MTREELHALKGMLTLASQGGATAEETLTVVIDAQVALIDHLLEVNSPPPSRPRVWDMDYPEEGT